VKRFRPMCVLSLAVLLVVGAGAASPVGAAATAGIQYPGNGSWQPEPATYGVTVVRDIPVRMTDGAVLRAEVGYPTDPKTGRRAAGRFPVLVSQDPYLGLGGPLPYFVQRGYIYATVSIRGSLTSTGPGGAEVANPLFGPTAGTDGAAVVNWAAHRLSGSNGVIGLIGCSFLGISALFTAAAVGPHSPVKAMVPACASFGYGFLFAGGIPGVGIGLLGVPGAPVIFGPQNLAANNAQDAAMAREVMAGGPRAYNGTYWQQRTTGPAMASKIVANGIPALLWTGWNALDGTAAPQFFTALQNAWAHRPVTAPMTPTQPRTGRYQIVIGPWSHGIGLAEDIYLEWFDTWLKGEKTGIADTQTPLHLNEKGGGRWVNASSYPLAQSDSVYYLGSSGSLQTQRPDASGTAKVRWAKPSEAGATLSYTTPAFPQAMTLAGPTTTSLYATSTTKNLELIASLEDVSPDGSAKRIARGTVLGSLSAVDPAASWHDARGTLSLAVHPYAKDKYPVPGSWHRYDITLDPSVWKVGSGHALRLEISTQSVPSDCLNFSGPIAPCLYTAPQQQTLPGGQYQISFGGSRASTLNVPLVQPSALTTARSGVTPRSFGQTEPLGW
jgi:predicted acyl esterase